MATFTYSAYDRAGKTESGSVTADSEKQARKLLRDKGLFPTALKTSAASSPTAKQGDSLRNRLFSRISNFDLALILRQLGILIRSGLPLEDSLKLIGEQADKKAHRIMIEGWRSEIVEGRSFSQAMSRSRFKVPEAVVAGTGVGEETGHLDTVLMRMSDELETGAENRQAFRRGISYPMFLVIASVAAISFIMVAVVPQITQLFQNARAELPLVTQVVVAISNFIRAYGFMLFLLLVGAVVFCFWYLSNDDRKRVWHAQTLNVPMLGKWGTMQNLGDWSRSLGTLLGSGVPALVALKIASSVMTNLHLRAKMDAVTERMRRGSSLHQSLKEEEVATGFLLHMVGSGEASSELDAMLLWVADYYSARLKSSVETFLKLLNPILIVGMGMAILVIVMAIMLPILELTDQV